MLNRVYSSLTNPVTPLTINPVQLSYAEWRAEDELNRQKEINDARLYYEGTQLIYLTERIRAVLGIPLQAQRIQYRLNMIRPVVGAVIERMSVKRFESSDPDTREWAWGVWQGNHMDVKQDEVYLGAVNESEAFVIVDWDPVKKTARWTPHQRYIDPTAGGDGFGCKAFYENDDPNQPIRYVSKRWREDMGGGKARLRKTDYYPDRIERFVDNGQDFVQIQEPGDQTWPVKWVDAEGQPLGVPVFHFTNPSLRPEAVDAWGVQDAVNATLIDLLANNRLTAFRIFVALGFIPTSDGKPPLPDQSNWLVIEPARIIGTSTKGPNEASFTAVEGASPEGFLKTLDKLIYFIVITTDTPLDRFQMTGAIAAEGTLKQQTEPLIAKIAKREMRFGDQWEDCLYMSRRLEVTFGGRQGLKQDSNIETEWDSIEKRATLDLLNEAKIKKDLGIPLRTLWREIGYTDEQIETMEQSPDFQARLALLSIGFGRSDSGTIGATGKTDGIGDKGGTTGAADNSKRMDGKMPGSGMPGTADPNSKQAGK